MIAFVDTYARPRVDVALRRHGLAWHPDDPETRASYWAMVKLVHAWPAGLDVFPARFRAAHDGRPPETIRELATWVQANAADLAAAPFPDQPAARWDLRHLQSVMPNILRCVQALEPGAGTPGQGQTPARGVKAGPAAGGSGALGALVLVVSVGLLIKIIGGSRS